MPPGPSHRDHEPGQPRDPVHSCSSMSKKPGGGGRLHRHPGRGALQPSTRLQPSGGSHNPTPGRGSAPAGEVVPEGIELQ